MKDFFWEVVCPVLGGVVLSVVLVLPLESASCSAKWKDSGYESDYGFFSNCRIKVGDVWIPADTLRALKDDAK